MIIVSETTSLAGSTTESLRNIELVKSLGLSSQEIKTIQSNMELGGFSTNKKYHKILHDETSRIRKTYSISTSYKTRMIKIVFNVNQFLRNHLIKS